MEDLMVLCNITANIYELSRPPTSSGPATPQLDEVGSQSSKDVDLDAEGYIHHFRDSSPQKVVQSQKIGSKPSAICAPSDDLTNKPDSRRDAVVNGSSNEPDAECYTLSTDVTFKEAWENPAMTRPCLTNSSKESLLNESFDNTDNTLDYAAMRSMIQAPPDPTIWGIKMVTRVSTPSMAADTEDGKASQAPSITDSHQPGPVHCTASRPSTPHNARNTGDRSTASTLDVTDARCADPSPKIPSNRLTSDAASLATQAWVSGHYGAAEDSDISAVSGRHGTVGCHGNLGTQNDNHASRVSLDGNRGDQCVSSSDNSDRNEPKATQELGRPNGQPNIRQRSRFSNSQDTEQDSLLAVSFGFLFGVFRSKLTWTQSLYHEIFDLKHALREMKSDTQFKMVGTCFAP